MKRVKGKWLVVGAVAVVVLVMGIATLLVRGLPQGPRPEGQPTPRPEGPEWVDLLDPAHVAGWKNVTDDTNIFGISDGVLHIYGRSLVSLKYAGYTAETFGDFDLHLEFKVKHRANSGVFLRAQANDPVYRGFEVQVLGDHGKRPSTHSCGAIYDVVSPMFNMSRPAGEWNSYDISVRGRHVAVVMNGWKIIDTDFALMTQPIGKFKAPYAELPLEGILALQDHGGEVWYRNVLIRKHAAGV
ncbi:MAG: DUF1080 domain-containing protein [Candidatus Hydrogenedentes bacterium]|nr:DUF1080 domain-containing protein [Candidatus Hydrogenedentota bacterium]